MTNNTPAPKASSELGGFFLAVAAIGAFVAYSYASPTTSRSPSASASTSKPVEDVLEKAREAVLLHYIKHADWGPIRCEEGEYEGRDMLYCHPSGNTRRGGLHVIRRDGGEPMVLPVNGTAKTQMQGDTIEAVDTSRIRVRVWDGPRFDIAKAIEATL